jgi:hypothetical protein
MTVSPVPIGFLLFLVGLRKLVFLPVLLGKVAMPGLIFVIVPVVIVLVIAIVDAIILRGGSSHDYRWRRQRSGKKYCNAVRI